MATQISAATSSVPPTSGTKLEDQTAIAALRVTGHKHSRSFDGNRFLDRDNKLSPAGSAAYLKYANPKDLPSFPSTGLRHDDSAAGVAASIGWANQKPLELWKPDPSASASKAAMLAKDYKAPPLWQAEQSANGAKAAIIAANEVGKVEVWKPQVSTWGCSAANQAFRSEKSGGLSPQIDYGYTSLGRQGSLMAATGAMRGTRKRSDSMPVAKPTYPDEANAVVNALSAAKHANDPSRRQKVDHPALLGTSPFTNMPKEMFTSHPPVAPEVDEKRRSDSLRASAVAMAKQIYSIQQRQIEQTKVQRSDGQSAAISAHARVPSTSTVGDEVQPMRFTSLQEAAQKLAHERLAKLHDEHAQNREYRSYYGDTSRPMSRLSIRGRVRRRASSDGTLDEDREQSQKIRAQMSLFSSNLSRVDEKKRQKDREALMAVAQRNVTASLHGMDERVFKDTGKIAPSMLNDWEVRAHAAAQKNSDGRMQNYGKIDIGGGRFIDQSAVDAVAARNVQPVLDEINSKAEQERVRQAEVKLEQEAQKRSVETKRAREKEIKEINRKLKEQDKEDERARREEEKAAKAEAKAHQKRDAKQEKGKGKVRELVAVENPMETEPEALASEAEAGNPLERGEDLVHEEPSHASGAIPSDTGYTAPTDLRTSMEMQGDERLEEIIHDGEKSPNSPTSPQGVKGWLRTKFTRRQSKAQKLVSKELINETSRAKEDDSVDVVGATVDSHDDSPTETAVIGVAAIENTVIENTGVENTAERMPGVENSRIERRASLVSSVFTTSGVTELGKEKSGEEEFEEAQDHFEELSAPPVLAVEKPVVPVKDSRFHEVM